MSNHKKNFGIEKNIKIFFRISIQKTTKFFAMSFQDVLKRGDEFLNDYPRTNPFWNLASHATCLFMITGSKIILNTFYKPVLHNIEKLDNALQRARDENRGLLTVMNHMSVVDDPAFYASLPWRYHLDIDTIRWGLVPTIYVLVMFSSRGFQLGQNIRNKTIWRGPISRLIGCGNQNFES